MKRLWLILLLLLLTGCGTLHARSDPVAVSDAPAVRNVGRMLADLYPPSDELKKVRDRITELHSGIHPAKALKYSQLFLKYSRKYGLDVNLVVHVAYIESRFTPDAYRSGNYGMMQINWRAHRQNLQKMGIDRQKLLDPETNIDYACRLLAVFSKKSKSLYGIVKRYAPARPQYYTNKLQGLMSSSDI
jgi:hypothetical protein